MPFSKGEQAGAGKPAVRKEPGVQGKVHNLLPVHLDEAGQAKEGCYIAGWAAAADAARVARNFMYLHFLLLFYRRVVRHFQTASDKRRCCCLSL